MSDALKSKFIREMYAEQIIQFGEFRLKSGIRSPFYIDLRKLVGFPQLIHSLTVLIQSTVQHRSVRPLVCGVPYGAIPLAVSYALAEKLPLLLLRKERKGYGKGQQVEGVWSEGQSIILMEDVITSGESIVESIAKIEEEGLVIDQIVGFVDRQQGGVDRIRKMGYPIQSILTVAEIIDVLRENLTEKQIEAIEQFIAKKPDVAVVPKDKVRTHPKVKELLDIAVAKKSNLILSADVKTTAELMNVIQACAPSVVAVKLHADTIEGFTKSFAEQLKDMAKQYQFLLMEDRKFADIGNTQYAQVVGGNLQISSWADLITMHFIAGKASIEIMEQIPSVGVVGIVEMSSKGTLTDDNYATQSVSIMESLPQLFVGAVCQKKRIPDHFLKFTPGIHLNQTNDDKGQQYNGPEAMIQQYGTDFMIVGRGIYEHAHPQGVAQEYQHIGWRCCSERLSLKLNAVIC